MSSPEVDFCWLPIGAYFEALCTSCISSKLVREKVKPAFIDISDASAKIWLIIGEMSRLPELICYLEYCRMTCTQV